jgi:hypothetical protein
MVEFSLAVHILLESNPPLEEVYRFWDKYVKRGLAPTGKIDEPIEAEKLAALLKRHAGSTVKAWFMSVRPDLTHVFQKAGLDPGVRNGWAVIPPSKNGNFVMLKCLLDLGVDVRAWDNAIVRLGAEHGHREIVVLGLERGADVNAKKGEPLRLALAAKNIEMIELLLAYDASTAHTGPIDLDAMRAARYEKLPRRCFG